MKKLITFFAMSNLVKVALRLTAIAFIFLGFSQDDKITICHMPPGNPDNCQQITISTNALQTHLDHGDRLFCYDKEKYNDYLKLVNNDNDRIIKMYDSGPHNL